MAESPGYGVDVRQHQGADSAGRPSSTVVTAYAQRAAEYAERLGSVAAMPAADRELIEGWASAVTGRILDLGSGPGHWTAHLHELGHDIEGVDPTPEFVDLARAAHPGVPYRVGGVDRLDPATSYGGILAWYSLIHVDPADLPATLSALRETSATGGRLLIGFCDGDRLEAFDHAVTTAYFWPVEQMAALVEGAGFVVDHTERRADPGVRRHGAIGAHVA